MSDSFVGLSITVDAKREEQCENDDPTEDPEKDRTSRVVAEFETFGAVKAKESSTQVPEKIVRASKTATHKLSFEKTTDGSIFNFWTFSLMIKTEKTNK